MVSFHGFNDTAEADSAISMRRRKRIRRFIEAEEAASMHGFNETTESLKKHQQHNFSLEC
jgi:hypothetical protein